MQVFKRFFLFLGLCGSFQGSLHGMGARVRTGLRNCFAHIHGVDRNRCYRVAPRPDHNGQPHVFRPYTYTLEERAQIFAARAKIVVPLWLSTLLSSAVFTRICINRGWKAFSQGKSRLDKFCRGGLIGSVVGLTGSWIGMVRLRQHVLRIGNTAQNLQAANDAYQRRNIQLAHQGQEFFLANDPVLLELKRRTEDAYGVIEPQMAQDQPAEDVWESDVIPLQTRETIARATGNHASQKRSANEMKKYYETLGLPETATLKQVKDAYKKLSLDWHPDKNPDNPEAAEKFMKIKAAYEAIISAQAAAGRKEPKQPEPKPEDDGAKKAREDFEAELDRKHREQKAAAEPAEPFDPTKALIVR